MAAAQCSRSGEAAVEGRPASAEGPGEGGRTDTPLPPGSLPVPPGEAPLARPEAEGPSEDPVTCEASGSASEERSASLKNPSLIPQPKKQRLVSH